MTTASEARSIQTNRTAREIAIHDFATCDKRGRAIGSMIITWEADYVAWDAEAHKNCGFNRIEPGHVFQLRTGATRNGEGYGPTQADRAFRSAAERDEAIAKYLEAARKRALKD